MQIATCLLISLNQSRAESSELLSSLSAYEHFYFGWGLFESDLQLKSLFYLTKSLEEQVLGQPFQYPNREIPSLTLVAMWQSRVIANRKYSTWQKNRLLHKGAGPISIVSYNRRQSSTKQPHRPKNPRSCKRSETLFKSLLFWLAGEVSWLAVEVLSPC